MFNRYVEGSATEAMFHGVTGLRFLSPNKLLCSDYHNYCLRLVDFTTESPSTSTFAGKCKDFDSINGHRLTTARLQYPLGIETGEVNSTVFFIDGFSINIRKIDLTNDLISVLKAFSTRVYGMLFYNNILYITIDKLKVSKFNVEAPDDVTVIAGGTSAGSTTGKFSITRFNLPTGIIMLPDSQDLILLVAEESNQRFA